jgi:hypothetical protein
MSTVIRSAVPVSPRSTLGWSSKSSRCATEGSARRDRRRPLARCDASFRRGVLGGLLPTADVLLRADQRRFSNIEPRRDSGSTLQPVPAESCSFRSGSIVNELIAVQHLIPLPTFDNHESANVDAASYVERTTLDTNLHRSPGEPPSVQSRQEVP